MLKLLHKPPFLEYKTCCLGRLMVQIMEDEICTQWINMDISHDSHDSHVTMLYSSCIPITRVSSTLYSKPRNQQKNVGSVRMSITRLKELDLPMRAEPMSDAHFPVGLLKNTIFHAVLGCAWHMKKSQAVQNYGFQPRTQRKTQQYDQHKHQDLTNQKAQHRIAKVMFNHPTSGSNHLEAIRNGKFLCWVAPSPKFFNTSHLKPQHEQIQHILNHE